MTLRRPLGARAAALIASVLACLAVVVAPSWCNAAAHMGQNHLAVSVGRSLPVRGQPVLIGAVLSGPGAASAPIGARFYARGPDGRTRFLGAGLLSQSIAWVPQRLGLHHVWCEASVGGLRIRSSRAPLFVTPRTLHLNYWACPKSQRWVTSVMDNDKDPASARAWLRRGVLPLQWKWGYGIANEWKTADRWVVHWRELLPERAGIMIDEFGGGGEVDEMMGRALSQVRCTDPRLFLAPYCVGVSGPQMVAGFRQADLVLVETYCGDWRSYGMIRDRWRSAERHGLGDRALATLGLGHTWATTVKEIRQQVAYVRATMPDMPGLAFFPDAPPRLMAAVDRAIYDYFLAPALLLSVEAGAGEARVRNIGCLPAHGVALLASVKGSRSIRVRVGAVEPGEERTVPLPEGAEHSRVAPGRYAVVESPDPLRRPPPGPRETREAAAYRERYARGHTVHLLGAAPPLEVMRRPPGAAGGEGDVEGARIPIAPTGGGRVAISFSIELGRVWFYGTLAVKLAGQGSLGFSWCHHEPDTDVHASVPRATLVFRDAGKGGLHETIPPPLGPERSFRFFAAYDQAGSVRGMLMRQDGTLLWDTGDLPVDGPLRCDHVRLEVTPSGESEIRYDPAGSRLFLRGVSGGPAPSPYVLESWVSDLVVHRERPATQR